METVARSVLSIVLWIPVAAYACIQAIVTEPDHTSVFFAGVEHRVEHTSLKSWPGGSKTKQAAELIDLLQLSLDEKQTWISLPVDDPDKGTDPGRGDIFWGDIDGAKKTELLPLSETYLISRACVVTEAVWNGTIFVLTITQP